MTKSTQRLHADVSVRQASSTHSKRETLNSRLFRRAGIALTSLALLLPSVGMAQGKAVEAATATMASATAVNGTATQETPLQKMQRLASETCIKYSCDSGSIGEKWQTDVTGIRFPGGLMSVIASIGNYSDGENANDVLVMVNGKAAALIPLDPISTAYEKETGRKLEQVFVVVANTEAFDPQIGRHVLLYIVPRETDKLTKVVPRLNVAITYGDTQKVFTEPDLVAMR